MKKERVLKYLILICTMVVSFFIFANDGVNALDYSVNDGKIVLQLEQVNPLDSNEGYSIVGASTTCDQDDYDCITDWHIPQTYDGKPIVEIKDSDNSISGVLSSVSKNVSGKVFAGNNLRKIGKCAFCDFDFVDEYFIGENVSLIGEYAFAHNNILKTINIEAFDNVQSELDDNAFNSSVNLSRIVFKNATISSFYYNSVSGWKTFQQENQNILFTFKVSYLFYNESKTSIEHIIEGYADEKLGTVPVGVAKKGLDFNWISSSNIEVNEDSKVTYDKIDETLGPVYEVYPSWKLKNPNETYIKTDFNGNSLNHKGDNKSILIDYIGKNTLLSISAVVDHDLDETDGLVVEYLWSKEVQGMITNNISTSDVIRVARVAESGIYTCKIVLKYGNYSNVIKTVSINVTIQPKTLIINVKNQESEYGDFLNSRDDEIGLYYEIDETTPLIDGEKIEMFKFFGFNEKFNVGEYKEILTGEITRIGYDNDSSNNYVNEYSITYNAGDLKVNPRILDLELEENIELEYGNNENLTKEEGITIYGEDKQLVVEYIREDVLNKNAGKYEVVGARIIKDNVIDDNYIVELPSVNRGKIVIKPRRVNVDWVIDENLVYSGIEKQVSASYKTIFNEVKPLNISITKSGEVSVIVNAGEYDLVASMITINDNYELIEFEKELVIEKADSVFIGAQRQVTIYNGLPQRVNVSLNHSEGVITYGDYSKCKNAHVSTSSACVINVSVEETENYKAISGEFKLHIDPYEFEVEPNLFEFDYGTVIGQYNLNSKFDGVNGEKVVVYFSKSGTTTGLNVGYYDIASVYLSDNTNYKATMVKGSGINKIKINKAPIEVRFFNYEGLVYDGKIKDVTARAFGTEEDVGLVLYYGNKNIIKNAGNYRIEASLTNDNYYISGNNYIEFSIAKATYDISNLKLENVETKFNFKNHFINLDGDLPNGLIATYTIDGNHGNGTYLPFKHQVKVTFEGDFDNYNYVEPLVATLYIDMTWVFVTLLLVIFVGVGIPLAFILLIKYKIIVFKKRIKHSGVRKWIKKSRELDKLYEFFRENRKQLSEEVVENEEEKEIIIEDPIKFIKNPVKVSPEEAVALSFVDELFRSNYGTKQFYSEVKNELLSYEGVVSKIKRDFETFYLNNMPIAKLDVVDGVLYTYFALDPDQYKVEEYGHEKINKSNKDFSSVPLKLKVDSIASLRHAKMFVRIIRKHAGIKSVSNFIRTDYVSVYTAKENTFKMFKKAFVKKGTKEYEED